MMIISLLNPGIENHQGSPSSNLGDLIIEEAVKREINNVFNSPNISDISTHQYLRNHQVQLIKASDLALIGGTNLLSSNMNQYRQWKITPFDMLRLNNIILFGVGWWQYQPSPNLYTKSLLQFILSHQAIHSVRDSYTESKLKGAGFENVINTGCPTMWPLIEFKQEDFPKDKASVALLMLTDYSKKPTLDKQLIELLFDKYSTVYFWPQGREDLDYILTFNHRLNILDHSLKALNNFLNSGFKFDYIGTRLHGGIKCLLAGNRSLILEIDNRATEIAKDTNLPTTERHNFKYISAWIETKFSLDIHLNTRNIERWKKQFHQKQ